MKINTKNTEVLCLYKPKAVLLQVSGNTLQQVKYLGVVFASDGRWTEDIDTQKANVVLPRALT